MNLQLMRVFSSDYCTTGVLLVDGKFACFTLEDPWQPKKIPGNTRIPAGTYSIGLRSSPRFTAKYGHPMLHILDIPGFEFVYFHPGNFPEDTRGCILVGSGAMMRENGIVDLLSSRRAYFDFYEQVIEEVKKGTVSLCVTDESFSTHPAWPAVA